MSSTVQAVTLTAKGGSLQGVLGYAKKELDINASAKEFASYYNSDSPDFINFDADFSPEVLKPFLENQKANSFHELSLEQKSKVIQDMFYASRSKQHKTMIDQYQTYKAIESQHAQLKKTDPNSEEANKLKTFLDSNKKSGELKLQAGKEFTFTIDKSISVAVSKLPKEQQDLFYKHMMSAGDFGLDIIKHHIKQNGKEPTYEKAKVSSLRSLHLTNRNRVANAHYHCVIFNFQETSKGLMSNDIPMYGKQFQSLINTSSAAFNSKLLQLVQNDPELSQVLKLKAIDKEDKLADHLITTEKLTATWITGEEKIKQLENKKYDKYIADDKQAIEKDYDQRFQQANLISDEYERGLTIAALALNKNREYDKFTSTEYIRKVKNILKPKKEEPGYSPEFLKAKDEVSFDTKQDDFHFKPLNIEDKFDFKEMLEDICKTNNSNILSYSDFIQISLQHSLVDEFSETRKIANDLLERHQDLFASVKVQNKIDKSVKTYYVPKSVLDENEKTQNIFRELANSNTYFRTIDKSFIDPSIKFEATQEKALEHGLSNSKLSLIRGVAGSGKSFVSTFIVEGHSTKNDTDKNFILAPTNKAIQELQEAFEAGVKAGRISPSTMKKTVFMTVNSFNLIQPKLTSRSLVLMDEAGMVSDALYADLGKQLATAGCKTVLVGDQHQLQSVAPGSMFKSLMSDQAMSVAKVSMTGIQRQKAGTAEHQLAQIISGSNVAEAEYESKIKNHSLIDEVFTFMEDNKFISVGEKQKEKLIFEYLQDSNSIEKKLVIAATNREVNDINKAIQTSLHNNSNDFVEADKVKYFVGDKVIFTEKAKDENYIINNGETATIKSFDKSNNEMVLEFANGTSKTIDYEKEGKKLALGYAITVHKSQGMTVNECYTYLTASQVNSYQNLYVSVTRSKNATKVYAEKDDYENIKSSYKADNEMVDIYEQAQTKFVEEKQIKLEDNIKREAERNQEPKLDKLNIDKVQNVFTKLKNKTQTIEQYVNKHLEPLKREFHIFKVDPNQKATNGVKQELTRINNFVAHFTGDKTYPDSNKFSSMTEFVNFSNEIVKPHSRPVVGNELANCGKSKTLIDESNQKLDYMMYFNNSNTTINLKEVKECSQKEISRSQDAEKLNQIVENRFNIKPDNLNDRRELTDDISFHLRMFERNFDQAVDKNNKMGFYKPHFSEAVRILNDLSKSFDVISVKGLQDIKDTCDNISLLNKHNPIKANTLEDLRATRDTINKFKKFESELITITPDKTLSMNSILKDFYNKEVNEFNRDFYKLSSHINSNIGKFNDVKKINELFGERANILCSNSAIIQEKANFETSKQIKLHNLEKPKEPERVKAPEQIKTKSQSMSRTR